MKLQLLVSTFITSLILSGCTLYDSQTSGRVVVRDGNTRVAVVFGQRDRDMIHRYYSKYTKKRYKKVPPGLAKKKRLTPGHQKQLHRKGRLPPGLQGRGLPYDLESRLSQLPRNYIRVRIGTDLVLMNRNTRIIADIIYDIAR